MATTAPHRVVGIDAAGTHGWLGITIDADGFCSARVGTLAEVVDWAEPVAVIGVDIPIGHISTGRRRADVEARAFVGPRRSSVFAALPTGALEADSYEEANAALSAAGEPKLSKQAWALRLRILEADELARSDGRVFEVHPEVSFCALAGEHLAWSKKSWNGLQHRRRLLADAGLVIPDVIPDIGGVVTDDVVDAAVVAWSARRIATGDARRLPDPPEERDGRQIAIWY